MNTIEEVQERLRQVDSEKTTVLKSLDEEIAAINARRRQIDVEQKDLSRKFAIETEALTKILQGMRMLNNITSLEQSTRFCLGCHTEKPISAYQRDRTRVSGYRTRCKECVQKTRGGKTVEEVLNQADTQKILTDAAVNATIEALADTKHCTECRETKLKSEFSKDRTRPDGLSSRCKVCDRARSKAYNRSLKKTDDVSAPAAQPERRQPGRPAKVKVNEPVEEIPAAAPVAVESASRLTATNRGTYKLCTKCKESKWLKDFTPVKDSKDGFSRDCTACIQKMAEKWKEPKESEPEPGLPPTLSREQFLQRVASEQAYPPQSADFDNEKGEFDSQLQLFQYPKDHRHPGRYTDEALTSDPVSALRHTR